MADWQRRLELQPEWDRARDGDISVLDLARVVATRLRALKPFDDEEIEERRLDIAADFDSLASDPDTTTDDFDVLMDELYGWADTPLDDGWPPKKVCWVNTIARVEAQS